MLHRLHQADIALLDKVEQIARGMGELAGDFNHQTQIGGDQPIGVGRVVMLRVALGDLDFFLAAEQRKAPNLGEIAAQRIERHQRAAVGTILSGLPRHLRCGLGIAVAGFFARSGAGKPVGQFAYLVEAG